MTTLEAVLDYETRSRAPLQHVGAIKYAKDASTSIFCLGYSINGARPKIWIPERAPMPDELWQCFKRGMLVAHNAAFERAITKYVLPRYPLLTKEQKKVVASLPISRWRCLAAKAAMCSLPRKLELVNQVLKLPTQKDQRGHKLILKYSKPRKPSKHNPAVWWSDKKDLRSIYRYCLTDVKAENELHNALPDLSEQEQKVWELDQKINDRGVLIDVPAVHTILKLVQEEVHEITRLVRKLSKHEIDGPGQRAKILKWVNDRGANVANLQAATIRDRLMSDDLAPKVRKMLEYRQAGSKTSTSKYFSMLKAVDEDHRARELLLYCGAIPTARWAGKRIQPHNFPRPTIKNFDSNAAIDLALKGGRQALAERYGKSKVMDVLVSIIRGMIIASQGNHLFCADFSAIEARIGFWVVGYDEGVEAFRQNKKLYEEMAAETFGVDLEWLLTEEGKNSVERFVGKEAILGCQYGLGWAKFLRRCHEKGIKQVTPDIAKKAVYTYRRLHHPVPEFWGMIERACIQAIKNPGKKYKVTKVTVYKKHDWLNIKLPSGRKLRYFNPRVTQKQLASGRMVPEIRYWTVDGYTKEWVETSIWGGVLLNHIVQGISRDLMVNGVFNIENAGYQFILSVHDEGLAERKKELGSVKEFVKLMTKLPPWAQGAPVTAEGWCGPRYRKG